MEKHYAPDQIENKWYNYWLDNDVFKPSENLQKTYSIVLPPPNVTGSLHMGHAFQHTLMDSLIRYHRMQGYSVLWQSGVDHAGIATQLMVERKLKKEGLPSRKELGRDKFLEKVWEWKNHSGDTIINQMKRMGTSCYWSNNRFTLDAEYYKNVIKAFVTLYDSNQIYKGKVLVNWDPVLKTAISDLEVIKEEKKGKIWYIKYPIEGSDEYLVVATTRPETMLADTCVAYNPRDKRYKKYEGKQVKLPLTNRIIPIIADPFVEIEFGTGCVKITPCHDFNDYKIGKAHNLPMINIFTDDAKINENAPEKYQGLDRFEAREKILQDLDNLGLLEKTLDHNLTLPIGDRSNAIIEPMLKPQWFVKVDDLAKEAMRVVRDDSINFVPKKWENTYFSWMENIEDWCISRQLWWGHRIPAWYDKQGNIYVAQNEKELREKYQLSSSTQLRQDEDVMDTWFSSALWTFASLGYPNQSSYYPTHHPTSVLVTGFDIIFFWVARMIMMTTRLLDQVPFKDILITGLIRDQYGQKMSKSKGNVIDPIDLIDGIDLEGLLKKRTENLLNPKAMKDVAQMTKKDFPDGMQAFGADALRFTFCSLSAPGRDINFSIERLNGYRNFCNKLWNAARFFESQIENTEFEYQLDIKQLSTIDKWILANIQKVIKETQEHIELYRMDLVAHNLYAFIWNKFCDWYIEFFKIELQNKEDKIYSQLFAIREILINILKLLHPLVPFITEEIWHIFKEKLNLPGVSIGLESLSEYTQKEDFTKEQQQVDWLIELISQIRAFRNEVSLENNKKVSLFVTGLTLEQKTICESHHNIIIKLAKLNNCQIKDSFDSHSDPVIIKVWENLNLAFDSKELLTSKVQNKETLIQQQQKLKIECSKLEQKLANKNFVSKAPQEVVKKEQDRFEVLKKELAEVEQLLKMIE